MSFLTKPSFKESFERDIIRNLGMLSDNFTKPLFLNQLIHECEMYATDMCIEFQKQSDGLLSDDWIYHITHEAGAVFEKLFPENFVKQDTEAVFNYVKKNMENIDSALEHVNLYYNR